MNRTKTTKTTNIQTMTCYPSIEHKCETEEEAVERRRSFAQV